VSSLPTLEQNEEYYRLHGEYEVIALGSPGAGSELVYVCPGSVTLEVIAATFAFTADNTAVTRIPFVAFRDNSDTDFCVSPTLVGVLATQKWVCSFGVGMFPQSFAGASVQTNGFPPIRLQDGLRVALGAVNLHSGDTITDARLYVCQSYVRP
jgi:hypothetical protein